MSLQRPVLSFMLAIALLICGRSVLAEAIIIDKIAAVVDGGIITYRDVKVASILKLSEGDDETVLEYLINSILLLKEAEKFKIMETKEDSEKIQGRFEEVRKSLDGERFNDFLREYNLTESDVIKKLTDQVITEKFINFRINFFIVISEEAIKTFYEEHKGEFDDRPFNEIHHQIKMRLFDMESEKRFKDYSGGLRKKARIFVNQ